MASLKYRGDLYVWEGSYTEKDIPKAAGLSWHGKPGTCRDRCYGCRRGAPHQTWWTDDPAKAARLVEYADPAAKAALAGTVEAVAASRATDAPDAVQPPAPDGKQFMPFQLAGIAYLQTHPKCLVGDEMGLGKTIQVLGLINLEPTIRRTLVVCPAHLRINWAREAAAWLVRPTQIDVLESGVLPAVPAGGDWLVVCSYERARKMLALLEIEWSLVVADEAHFVKNPKSQRSKAFLGTRTKGKEPQPGLVGRALRVLLLTGTPIPNRPVEIHPLLAALDSATWGNWHRFVTRYCNGHRELIRVRGGRTRSVWSVDGASHLDELQQCMRATVLIRRRKMDVLKDLPEKQRQVIPLPRNGAEQLLEQERQLFARRGLTLEQAAEAMTGGGGYQFEELSALRLQLGISKIEPALEHITAALAGGVEKLVVWAHHHEVIDGLVAGISEAGYVCAGADGRNSDQEREAIRERFQTDPALRVIVCGLTAMGVGHTLTAASDTIFVELDWVPGNNAQAEDRLHRIGQLSSVTSTYLVYDGSLDSKLVQFVASKERVIRGALDEAPRPIPAPTGCTGERPATTEPKAEIPVEITADQITAVHLGLRILAGQCDGARTKDSAGFNRFDTVFGHELASRPSLTVAQALAGRKLLHKYARQLGEDLIKQMGG